MHTQAQHEIKLLPMNAVAEKLGCDKSTVYRLIREGKFPKGRKLTNVTGVKWLSSEVDSFILDEWKQAEST